MRVAHLGTNMVSRMLIVVVLSSSLVSCGRDDPAAACAQGRTFAAARQRVEVVVSDLASTNTVELEEAIVAITDQVGLMREISPRSLRDPLGVLLAAYGQLLVSLEAVGFDPRVATGDAAVAAARAAFADDSIVTASISVEEFLAQQCEIALAQLPSNFAVVGTTLPPPAGSDEAARDDIEDERPTDQELAAIAQTLVDRFGISLGEDDAVCLGTQLLRSDLTRSDADIDDASLVVELATLFARCSLDTALLPTTDPTTVSTAAPTTIPTP